MNFESTIAILMGVGVVLSIALSVGVSRASRSFDEGRIAEQLRRRGCQLLSVKRAGFWEIGFKTDHNRVYLIRYRDMAGGEHATTCKTSMGNGVYFSLDEAHVSPPRLPSSLTVLEIENLRLRAELDRLKRLRS